jgi:hypothetical protein
VPEWRATLDALQEIPEIGAEGPVGYFGGVSVTRAPSLTSAKKSDVNATAPAL